MTFQRDGEVVREIVDTDRIERAVREILIAIGEDPDRDGLRETIPRPTSTGASCSNTTSW